MKASIVTISFNQARYLPRAIESVLSQDHPDLEYIVVDPGSTDGSREIIDEHRDRLARIVLDPDDGPADGLNKGFALATGDVLAYVNADDALLPGAVSEAVGHLTGHPDVDVVYGDGYVVDGDGWVVRAFESSPFNVRRFAYGGVSVLQQATFIRRSAFDRAGGFNTANPTCWDSEILADIAMVGGKLRHLPRAWGVFTVHPESISGSGRLRDRYVADQRRIFRKLRGRTWRPTDSLIAKLARVEKWLVAPGTTWRRLNEALKPPQRVRLVQGGWDCMELVPDEKAPGE